VAVVAAGLGQAAALRAMVLPVRLVAQIYLLAAVLKVSEVRAKAELVERIRHQLGLS
jgi:hypothetical protein